MYSRTVLIVEDEPLIRMMLADALEDEGHSVLEAGTALEAIAILGMRDVDAVVTDIDMPGGLNGLDLTRFLGSCKQGLPVIVTSGGHMVCADQLHERARFVAKPYQLGHLIGLLDELTLLAPRCRQVISEARVA